MNFQMIRLNVVHIFIYCRFLIIFAFSSENKLHLGFGMRNRILYILWIVALVVPLSANATYHAPFYDRWTGLSSGVLMKKASDFILKGGPRDSALVCYTIVANRYFEMKQNEADINHSANAMNNAGYMYFFYFFDYQKAYSYFLQSLEVVDKYDLADVKPYVYLNLANLYRSCSEMEIHGTNDFNDTIIHYYKKAFYSSKAVNDWKAFAVAFYGLTYYAFKTGRTKEVNREMLYFCKTKAPMGTTLMQYDRYFCSAIRCFERNETNDALRLLDKMLGCIDAKYTPERYEIMTMEIKSLLLSRLNRNDEAIALLKQAEGLSLRYNARDLQVDVYHNLYKCYQAEKSKPSAEKYQLIYFQKKDSLLNVSKLQSISEMHFLEQLHKVNDRVRNLSQQRAIQRIVICVILVVTVVIVFFLLLLARNYRRLRSDHEQLYLKNVEALKREEMEKVRMETYEKKLAELSALQGAQQTMKAKHPSVSRTDEDKETIRQSIDKVMGNTDEICSSDFSLNRLADLLDMKYWNVSHDINEIYGKNFNALLNEYRIKIACRRLNDFENFGNYTIEAIASGTGFKSRSNFVTIFKSITGLTPSEYLNMAKRNS